MNLRVHIEGPVEEDRIFLNIFVTEISDLTATPVTVTDEFAALEIGQIVVEIRGPAASGKSRTARAIMEACRKQMWSARYYEHDIHLSPNLMDRYRGRPDKVVTINVYQMG